MKSYTKICKAGEVVDSQRGIIRFVLTSKTDDRDGDVVEPSGAIIDNYVKNPVFMWVHDLRSLPIGRVIPESISITKKKITGDVMFDMNDPFAREVFRKYKEKFLNAGSIRFRPIDYDVIKGEDGEFRGYHFKTWELLEFSAVPVPANPQALVVGRKSDDPVYRDVQYVCNNLEEPTPEQWAKYYNEKREDGVSLEQIAKEITEIRQEIKEGRVLSEKNFQKLQEAVRILEEVLRSAERKDYDEGEYKRVIPFRATPTASEDREWDKGAAINRIKQWAAGDNEFDLENPSIRRKFAQAFAYVEGDGTRQGDYKLPHHDIENGQLVVVWRGVAAAMAALMGARGGVNIPDSDRRGVYNHLARHYRQFDKEPPEFKSVESLEDHQLVIDLIVSDENVKSMLIQEVKRNLTQGGENNGN